mmetsp:Transcript_72725/g.194037  ORF Transcript_72725/g.194037 Transcript_72725/m.194037 type:complete len:343 (-) Transcript_72725:2810-3838(-)
MPQQGESLRVSLLGFEVSHSEADDSNTSHQILPLHSGPRRRLVDHGPQPRQPARRRPKQPLRCGHPHQIQQRIRARHHRAHAHPRPGRGVRPVRRPGRRWLGDGPAGAHARPAALRAVLGEGEGDGEGVEHVVDEEVGVGGGGLPGVHLFDHVGEKADATCRHLLPRCGIVPIHHVPHNVEYLPRGKLASAFRVKQQPGVSPRIACLFQLLGQRSHPLSVAKVLQHHRDEHLHHHVRTAAHEGNGVHDSPAAAALILGVIASVDVWVEVAPVNRALPPVGGGHDHQGDKSPAEILEVVVLVEALWGVNCTSTNGHSQYRKNIEHKEQQQTDVPQRGQGQHER